MEPNLGRRPAYKIRIPVIQLLSNITIDIFSKNSIIQFRERVIDCLRQLCHIEL